MPLQIVRDDITKMHVDAIVNSANSRLLGGGGADGCIHRAAGKGLSEECGTLGKCGVGEAKVTGGYDLPCKYVIHTVGPQWFYPFDTKKGKCEKLALCYVNSLESAKAYGCESVAFPLISSGAYGFPKDVALRVAVNAVSGFLAENDMTVYLVVFDKKSYAIGKKLYSDIAEYIDDNYAKETAASIGATRYLDFPRTAPSETKESAAKQPRFPAAPSEPTQNNHENETARKTPTMLPNFPTENTVFPNAAEDAAEVIIPATVCCPACPSLEEALEMLDESFSEMLLRKIDERGMTDVQCYKKANIDRKLFSKIRSDRNYKPSKPTVIAFAVALELTLPEMQNMLMKAGFALSHSNKFDIIVEYFVRNGNYNIFEINEALFAFDQTLLGV